VKGADITGAALRALIPIAENAIPGDADDRILEAIVKNSKTLSDYEKYLKNIISGPVYFPVSRLNHFLRKN